jgi:hypothetical protein
MSKTSKTIRKMCVLAGISAFAAVAAAAVPGDGQISIDRALNSPTLTVRYEGANAALVELRINGESLGTRSVSSAKSAGETNFTINLSELKDGDNEVEVRLFDRTGKVVGTEHTNISTDQTNYGPVFLKTPKMGATVSGPVEIDMGFGRDLKNVFVSFFVDNNFKKMTNYPPYTMVWDTTGETNGWHEVEAWAIDESSTTYKTRKVRIFLNNPGGRTDRSGVTTDLQPTTPKIGAAISGASAGVKPMPVKGSPRVVANQATPLQPISPVVVAIPNKFHAEIGAPSGAKAVPEGGISASGPRAITPTHGEPVAAVTARPNAAHTNGVHSNPAGQPSTKGYIAIVPHKPDSQTGVALRAVETASALVRITKGQRLPNLSTFEVVYNSAIVDFPDVQPRVDDGIPMTPFRYLFEKAGGTVDWTHLTKTVSAKSDGHEVSLRIGDKLALVNKLQVRMETAPYIDRGRTIVPLSFIDDALNVNVDYDKETGHVLITSKN